MKQPSGKRTALNVNSSTSFSIRHRRIKETWLVGLYSFREVKKQAKIKLVTYKLMLQI